MVDGINFNPFTGKVLTPEEIDRLDANKDGKVDEGEFSAGYQWLSGGEDSDGDVQIGADNALVKAAQNSGMTSQAANADELKQNITILLDEFIEQYLAQNKGISSDERTNIISVASTASNSFVTEYLNANPKGPYDMTEIGALYQTHMEDAIANNKKEKQLVDAAISGLTDSVDSNYQTLLQITNEANADNYIKGTEWNQIKNKAVQYLMGSFMTDNIDKDLLKNINPNYEKNSNYIEAKKAFDDLKKCSDPAKMQELLAKAQEKLADFLQQSGATHVIEAIQDTEKSKYEGVLTSTIDKMVEEYSHTKRTDIYGKVFGRLVSGAQVEKHKTFLNNCMTEFLKTYKGDGSDIEAKFKEFVEKVNLEKNKVDAELYSMNDGKNGYDALNSAVEKVGSYISDEEKENIIKLATNMFILNLGNTNGNNPLATIYPNCKSDPLYVQAKKLYDGLSTSATPQADFDKFKELIEKMMRNLGVDNIVKGVEAENKINVKVSVRSITGTVRFPRSAKVSSAGEHWYYGTNYKVTDGKVEYTNKDIKSYMNNVKNELQIKMKSQLGDLYNDAMFEECFKQAELYGCFTGACKTTKGYDCFVLERAVNALVSMFNELMTDKLHNNVTLGSVPNNSGDKTLPKGSGDYINYNKNDRYTDSEGRVHIKDKDQDKKFQDTMNNLYSALVTKYKAALGDKFNEPYFKTLFNNAILVALTKFDKKEVLFDGSTRKGDGNNAPLSKMVSQTLYELDIWVLATSYE